MSILRIAAIAAALYFSVNSLAEAQTADPAVFGELPTIQEAHLSPDGTTIAMIQNSGGSVYLVFSDITGSGAPPKGIGIGDVKTRAVRWVDNEFVILLVSDTKNFKTAGSELQTGELWRWIAMSRKDESAKMLFQRDAGFYNLSAGALLATTPDKDGDAIFARWTPNARVAKSVQGRLSAGRDRDIGAGYSLFNVNLKTTKPRQKFAGREDTIDWIIDANGDPIFRIDASDNPRELRLLRRKGTSKQFEIIQTYKPLSNGSYGLSIIGLNPTGDEIIATGYDGENTRGVFALDVVTGEKTRTVFRDGEYDISGLNYDPLTASVTGIRYTDQMSNVVHLNPETQKLQDRLAKALPGATPTIVSQSLGGAKHLINAQYADRPSEYFIYDVSTRNLAFFSSSRPSLAQGANIRREPFSYATEDGLTIPGYLSTPAGAEKVNLPLIVLPHGGPEARDNLSFDWWSAFYAANGYAVYQPNFRGSNGYGSEFRRAGYNQWGEKMQDDVDNGVQKLIDAGIADASRTCIVGASYGGYAALVGATFNQGGYKCAVSVNGVSDIPSLIGAAAADSQFGARYWEERIGSRFKDRKHLSKISPVRQVTRDGPAVMIIHGKDDTVVPYLHATRMRDALKSAGRSVEFVSLDGEDHWLSKSETRIEMLRQSLDFINQQIGE